MKTLYLNLITSVPNEDGKKIIEKAIKSARNKGNKKEDNFLSREWFIEQGLTPPDGDEEDDIAPDENGMISLTEEHIQEVLSPLSIPLKNIDSWHEAPKQGSMIYTKVGMEYNVAEDVWEIDDYVKMMSLKWYQKEWIVLRHKVRKLKNKILGKKEVTLEEILSRPENKPNQ